MWNFLTKTKVGRWILLALIGAAAITLGLLIATNGEFIIEKIQLFSILTLYGGILLANFLLVINRRDLGNWRPFTDRQLSLKRMEELRSIKIKVDLADLRKLLEAIAFIITESNIDFEQKAKELLKKEGPATYQEIYDYYKDKKIAEDNFYHLVRLKCFYTNSVSNSYVLKYLRELKEREVQEEYERALMEKIYDQIQKEDSVD